MPKIVVEDMSGNADKDETLDDFDFSIKHNQNKSKGNRPSTAKSSLSQKLGIKKKKTLKYNNTIAHTNMDGDNPFLHFDKDTKKDLSVKNK